jgi:hypothetical protein
MCSFEMPLTSQKKSARGHDTAELQHTVASPKTKVSKDLSTRAKESVSLQKAREWAQSHAAFAYGKFGSLGDVVVIVKHSVCDYVVMLVCSSCVGFQATTSGILERANFLVYDSFAFDDELL